MTCANNVAYPFTITVLQSDGKTPYDLTGAAIEIQFKRQKGASDGSTPTVKTADGSIAVRSPATAGLADALIPLVTIEGMQAGKWYWDALITPASGPKFYGGGGRLFVTQGITESATPSLAFAPPTGTGGDDGIVVTAPGDGIVLTLAPGGPPGTGADYPPQAVPAPPLVGFIPFTDQDDGKFKAISANGNITTLALP